MLNFPIYFSFIKSAASTNGASFLLVGNFKRRKVLFLQFGFDLDLDTAVPHGTSTADGMVFPFLKPKQFSVLWILNSGILLS